MLLPLLLLLLLLLGGVRMDCTSVSSDNRSLRLGCRCPFLALRSEFVVLRLLVDALLLTLDLVLALLKQSATDCASASLKPFSKLLNLSLLIALLVRRRGLISIISLSSSVCFISIPLSSSLLISMTLFLG